MLFSCTCPKEDKNKNQSSEDLSSKTKTTALCCVCARACGGQGEALAPGGQNCRISSHTQLLTLPQHLLHPRQRTRVRMSAEALTLNPVVLQGHVLIAPLQLRECGRTN